MQQRTMLAMKWGIVGMLAMLAVASFILALLSRQQEQQQGNHHFELSPYKKVAGRNRILNGGGSIRVSDQVWKGIRTEQHNGMKR